MYGVREAGLSGQVVDATVTGVSSSQQRPRRSVDFWLIAILVVAGLLRLAVLLVRSSETSRFLTPDTPGYRALSRDLSAFTSESNPHFSLSMLRTPVYPLYLAATRDLTGSSIVGPMILQVLVAVGAVYVTYRLGLSLFDRPVGLWAAALLALDPLSIVYSSLILTEALFAFFLVCSVLLLWRPEDNTWARGLASGVLLGVATLTRPVSFYLSVLLAVGFLVLERSDLRRAIVVALSFLVGFGVVAGGWVVRNDVMGGDPTISTIEGYNLLYYRAVGALEEGQGLTSQRAYAEVSKDLRAELPPRATPDQIDRAEQSVARSILVNNPEGYAKEVIKGAGRLVFGSGGDEFIPATGGHATDLADAYGDLYLFVLYVLVVVGLWAAWRKHKLRNCIMPLIVIVYATAVSSGLEAYSRFRMPIMPFLSLLAGAGAVAVVSIARDFRARSTGAPVPPKK
jgi:hypothetical protein